MATQSAANSIPLTLPQIVGCKYPIIAGPMFLVSDENLVVAVSEAGALGAMPSLNWRTSELFDQAVAAVQARTQKPFAVNLIVNKANPRVAPDLNVCVKRKVPVVITSLGNPKDVIQQMHAVGGKVFCDVTTLEYALKVEALGADAVIAVSAGAGGHAGPTSPLVLIPHLRKHLKIPVIAAGGIATGQQIAACLLLGAGGVQLGTRFIASTESKVQKEYKDAIVKAEPEDIVLTEKISGTPAAVIRTPYIDRQGLRLNPVERALLSYSWSKKWVKLLRSLWGSFVLSRAAKATTWKEVWSAGQSVGLIEDVLPCASIVENLMKECNLTLSQAASMKAS